MKLNMKFERFFAYAAKKQKFFYSDFCEGVNIVHGLNTSGKSTLLQSILFTFGINEYKAQLQEILNEDLIFRLDCTLVDIDKNQSEKVIFIREDETIFIKVGLSPTKRFDGIGGNSSGEHIKLKKYFHELFGFSLCLESQGEYKPASIETMFLPYYVAQSVGWVYLRKSFSSLDYYRNFKDDYLDYYLGVESSIDRMEKQKLENESKKLAEELSFYTSMAEEDDDIQLAKLIDEEYSEKSRAYIESHQSLFDELLKSEKEYVKKCNKLSYYQQRQSVLRNVGTNHKQQKPKEGVCPVCTQNLPHSTEEVYKYFQEVNDTEKEKLECKGKVKDIQSSINSLKNKITKLRAGITTEYSILKKLSKKELTYEEWLKIKAKTKLLDEIDSKVGKLTIQKRKVDEKLTGFKTEETVQKFRNKKDQEFKTTFLSFLTDDLGVKASDEDRHSKLYKISSFPSQGVELHKTVLGYHFAFNHLISQTSGIHQFPFLLDAVFKEDIDSANKRKIIKFIADKTPKGKQLFFSVANTQETENDINTYNSTFFKGEAKLICMGESKRKRSFLKPYDDSLTEYIDKTFDIMEPK